MREFRIYTVLIFLITVNFIFGCKTVEEKNLPTIYLNVENSTNINRKDALVVVDEEEILNRNPDFNKNGFVVYNGEEEVPSQYNSGDQEKGVLLVIPLVEENSVLNLRIEYDPENDLETTYPKRTQAELSHKFDGHFENRKYVGGEFYNVNELHVPLEHTDHSWFIRYEGPGWESDMVGYRFYLDWRNGVDVFGKTVSEPILQLVGQDGFDSYHEMQDWGMDVLKVGKTLGVGSIATFIDGKARRVDVTDSLFAAIANNGPIYSSILTKYYGWDLGYTKTTITSNISIHAGTRLTKQELHSSESIENFATGLIKDPKAELLLGGEGEAYGYLATYGKQSLNDDLLGIAVIFPKERLIEITDDGLSHVVVLNPIKQRITYYFLAAWEKEKDGIKSKEEFVDYLEQVIEELSHPMKISLN
ncbi:DUF4861 domain-containing protein [Aquiflexum sp.]|uniref:DUF4861 domain-containing protein n=1 Tax=Aquiflexum sp. TaxID=1872584 RepID=UPI00359467E2